MLVSFFRCVIRNIYLSYLFRKMITSLYLSFLFTVIAFLSSLCIYRQSHPRLYLNLFPVFLLVTVIMSGFIDYFSAHKQSNLVMFNILTSLQFCFYLFVLKEIIRNPTAKRVIFFAFMIYPFVAILIIFFIQKITFVLTISYALGCLFIVAFSIFYFFELFQLPSPVNLLKQPQFWICSGLLFYFSCSFFVFSFLNFLKSPSHLIGKNLEIIANLLDVLLYTSFTVAFLCRIKIRKSTH